MTEFGSFFVANKILIIKKGIGLSSVASEWQHVLSSKAFYNDTLNLNILFKSLFFYISTKRFYNICM